MIQSSFDVQIYRYLPSRFLPNQIINKHRISIKVWEKLVSPFIYNIVYYYVKICGNQREWHYSKEDNSNGILFSSRPLKVGESLEVVLDGMSRTMQGGGLEIGVTDLDPMTLTSESLPRSATDLDTGRTVMVSGWTLALNGKEIEMISRNTHDIKVGVTVQIRVMKNSNLLLLI